MLLRVRGPLIAFACAAAVAVSAQTPAGPREPTRDVVLAIHQEKGLHVLDADTLETLGRIATRSMAFSVAASPDGRMLFVAQAMPDDERGCCALYAFELATRRSCPLVSPAQEGVPTADGRWLFAQRGNVGIEVFDLPTLSRLPALHAERPESVYDFHPSPDARWLFAQSLWGDRWTDVFDLRRGQFARRIPSIGSAAAWLGDAYYILGTADGSRVLSRIEPDTGRVSGPTAIASSAAWATESSRGNMIGAADRLFIYHRSAPWLIRRGPLETALRGVRIVDPLRARVDAHLLPAAEIADLAASADGSRVFALVAPAEVTDTSTLVHVDAQGRIVRQRSMATGGWRLATAAIPRSLVPSGDVTLASCTR